MLNKINKAVNSTDFNTINTRNKASQDDINVLRAKVEKKFKTESSRLSISNIDEDTYEMFNKYYINDAMILQGYSLKCYIEDVDTAEANDYVYVCTEDWHLPSGYFYGYVDEVIQYRSRNRNYLLIKFYIKAGVKKLIRVELTEKDHIALVLLKNFGVGFHKKALLNNYIRLFAVNSKGESGKEYSKVTLFSIVNDDELQSIFPMHSLLLETHDEFKNYDEYGNEIPDENS